MHSGGCGFKSHLFHHLGGTLNTKQKGDISEAIIIARLLQLGYDVLEPRGDRLEYDIVVDTSKKFIRIQCKTGLFRNGVITARCCGHTHKEGKHQTKHYVNIDYLAIYCEDLDKVYMIDKNDIQKFMITLRIDESRNGQRRDIRYAKNYELRKGFECRGVM